MLADSAAQPAGDGESRNTSGGPAGDQENVGFSVRSSDTTGRPYMYAARLVNEDSEILGYPAAGVAAADVETQTRQIRLLVWGGAAVTAAIAMLVAYLLSSRFSSRLARIAETANAIAEGDYEIAIDDAAGDEVGTLSRAFNRMRTELETAVHRPGAGAAQSADDARDHSEARDRIDQQQRILLANAGTHRLLNLTADDITGQRIWEAIRLPLLHDAINQTISGQEPYSTELELLEPPRVVTFRGQAFLTEAGRGIIMVLDDITELRRLERVRQGVCGQRSHEIKTPLTAIKAFTETLLEGNVDDRETANRFLERIDEQADRLLTLVFDMLVLARADARDQAFDIQPVLVDQIVQEVVDGRRLTPTPKASSCSREPGGQNCQVLADTEGLATIVGNLVDNAIKYTRRTAACTCPAGWRTGGLPFSSRIPASVFPKRTRNGFSSDSTVSTKPARGHWAERALACPSSNDWPRLSAAPLTLPAGWSTALRLSCDCRSLSPARRARIAPGNLKNVMPGNNES